MKAEFPSCVLREHLHSWLVCLGLCLSLTLPLAVRAQTDDFSDGNDTVNPTWIHSSVLGTTPTFDASGFNYHLHSEVGPFALGYAGSFVAPTYADFVTQFDLVGWMNNGGQAFAVAARCKDINVLGGIDGYGFAYELNTGKFVIYKITDASLTDLSAQAFALDPSKHYRFVFTGAGSTLSGQAYEIGGSAAPVASLSADDATYASGQNGVFGYSGGNQVTDFTIDNFAAVPEPGWIGLTGLGLSLLWGWRRSRR